MGLALLLIWKLLATIQVCADYDGAGGSVGAFVLLIAQTFFSQLFCSALMRSRDFNANQSIFIARPNSEVALS